MLLLVRASAWSRVALHRRSRPTPASSAGEAAEAREDYDTAFDDYQKAYAKAPKDLTYTTALYRVQGFRLIGCT